MKLSIVTKIVLLLSTVIVVFAGVSYYQLAQINKSTRSLDEINKGYVPLSKIITRIDTAFNNLNSDMERLAELEEAEARKIMGRTLFGFLPRLLNQHISQGLAHCDRFIMVTKVRDQQKFYADIKEKLVRIKEQYTGYIEVARLYMDTINKVNSDEELEEVYNDLNIKKRQLERSIKVISLKMESHLSQNVRLVEKQSSNASWSGIVLTLSAFIVALILMSLSILMLKPLRKLTEAAHKIGEGEYRYSVVIPSGDEMGTLAREFENMRLSLIQRDKELKEQADKLELSNLEVNMLKIHYENIIKNLWLPVLVGDVQQNLTTVNPKALSIWGDELNDSIGLPIADLPLAEQKLGEIIPLDQVLNLKKTFVRESVKVKDTQGDIRRITFTAVPFLDQDKIKGLLIIGEDVTDELRMRDSMLQNERMAAVGRVSAKIAHEIRNPLSSIQLNTEMLQDEIAEEQPDMGELQPILKSIVREVARLHDITDAHLSMSKSKDSNRNKVELNKVIANLADFYRAEMSRQNVECKLDLFNSSVEIIADENQIVRAFHNLIRNSIEAMEDGGALELKTEKIDKGCKVSVADSGPGISQSNLDKIFDPYFSTKSSGTGLGLAIVKQIIDEYDGEIEYETSKLGGSCFVITLYDSYIDKDEDGMIVVG